MAWCAICTLSHHQVVESFARGFGFLNVIKQLKLMSYTLSLPHLEKEMIIEKFNKSNIGL